MDYEVRNNLLESENQLYKSELKARLDKIKGLEEENRKLKEKISEVNMISDDEKQSIEHILELEEENKKMNDLNSELRRINNKIMDKLEQKTRLVNYYRREKRKLKGKIRFLEQCLDNKEKVNKSMREDIKRLSDFLECES